MATGKKEYNYKQGKTTQSPVFTLNSATIKFY